MALAEYSIEEGLSKFVHTFMKPDKVPLGYAYTIQKNADKVILDVTLHRGNGDTSEVKIIFFIKILQIFFV